MADPGTIDDAVRLYRMVGRPPLTDGCFSGEVGYMENKPLLLKLHDLKSFGRFDTVKIDGEFSDHLADLTETGERAEFEFNTGSSPGFGPFFESIADLRTARVVQWGSIPERFYLVDEDYLHGAGEPVREEVRHIEAWAEFVDSLRDLSKCHRKDGACSPEMFFVSGDDLGCLRVNLTPDILSERPDRVMQRLMDNLLSDIGWLSDATKLGRFADAMVEVLAGFGSEADFSDFVDCIPRVLELYREDGDQADPPQRERFNGLMFGVRRSVRYHQRRRGFLEGAGSLMALSAGMMSLWGMLLPFVLVAIPALIGLAWSAARKARDHEGLARRFAELERKLEACSPNPTEGLLAAIIGERLDIEADEPPVLRTLDVLCHNELARAMGHGPEQQYEITPWRRCLAQVFSFGNYATSRRPGGDQADYRPRSTETSP